MSIFYNLKEKNYSYRYLLNGKILFKWLKENINKHLEYKEIDYNIFDTNELNNNYLYFTSGESINIPLSNYVIGRDINLNFIYENKFEQYKYFNKYMIDAIWLNKKEFILNISKYINKNYILQPSIYSAGKEMILLDNNINKSIFKIFKSNKYVKIMKYQNCKHNLAVQVMLFKDGYKIMWMIDEILKDNFLFIGSNRLNENNYSKKNLDNIKKLVDNIANELIFKYKCKGVIGIDILINENDEIYMSEINCRKGATMCLYGLWGQYEYNIPLSVLEYFACSNYSINDVEFYIKNKYEWKILKTKNDYQHIDIDKLINYCNDNKNCCQICSNDEDDYFNFYYRKI